MDNRTSIEELMRQGTNTVSQDDSMVDSILEEIQNDKQLQLNQQQQQQQKQQQQHQINSDQERQQMMEQKMMEQKMMEQKMMEQKMMEHNMMEQRRMIEQRESMVRNQESIKNPDDSLSTDIPLLKEFTPTLIFLIIFILLNITQINQFICDNLSIDNNNIFILLKGFIG